MSALKKLGSLLLLILALAAALCPMLTRNESAAMVALAQQGKKYVFNTEGENTFDCSGLVLYAYATVGLEVEHWANGISKDENYETFEKISQAHIGDLIFFDTVSNKVPVDHVGIWIGDNRFVHASSSIGKVAVSEVDDHWRECFTWGKRLLKITDIIVPAKKETSDQ